MGQPKISEQRLVAAKVEAVIGTAEALTATEAVFNVFDPKMEPTVGFNKRQGQGSLSQLPGVAGSREAKFTFSTELVGNGSAGLPAWATVFLPACAVGNGGGTNATFAPINVGSASTLTMALYEDGKRRQIAGAMGTFKINLEAGKQGMIEWEFQGKYSVEADVALLAPTYPTTLPPVFEGATVSVGAYTPVLSKMVFDLGNKLQMRQDATDATGFKACTVVDRDVTGTFDPETEAVATKSWMADLTSNTTAALSVVVGSVTNNTITLAGPKFQVMKAAPGDRGGILTTDVEFQLGRSATAGLDEFTITFG